MEGVPDPPQAHGVLSPLFFRIVGKGKPLGGTGIDEKNLFMVGEGGQDCFAYLAQRQAKDGKGLAIESFGLDLLSGKPEGVAILDGIINYARNPLMTVIMRQCP